MAALSLQPKARFRNARAKMALIDPRAITFWSRPGTSSHGASLSAEQRAYLDLYDRDDMTITLASVPIWTLGHDFATEALTLQRRNGQTSVRWSDGGSHGRWYLTRRNEEGEVRSVYLCILYTRNMDDVPLSDDEEYEAALQDLDLRFRYYELLWGTSAWVKRPDAEGDGLEWSVFLVPLITSPLRTEPRGPRGCFEWLRRALGF